MSQREEVVAFIQEALETIEAIHRREDSLHRYDQRTGGEAAKYYCDRITILPFPASEMPQRATRHTGRHPPHCQNQPKHYPQQYPRFGLDIAG